MVEKVALARQSRHRSLQEVSDDYEDHEVVPSSSLDDSLTLPRVSEYEDDNDEGNFCDTDASEI